MATRQPEPATSGGIIKRDPMGFTIIPQAYSCRAVLSDDPAAPQVITNLNMNDPEQMSHYMRSVGASDENPAKMKGKAFSIKWFVVTKAQVRSQETGEIVTLPRVTWISPDGLSVAFSSWTVCRYMDAILAVKGIGPYDPPISVTVDNAFLDGAKRTYEIQFTTD